MSGQDPGFVFYPVDGRNYLLAARHRPVGLAASASLGRTDGEDGRENGCQNQGLDRLLYRWCSSLCGSFLSRNLIDPDLPIPTQNRSQERSHAQFSNIGYG